MRDLPWKKYTSIRQVGPSSRSGSSAPRVGSVEVEGLEYEPCACGGLRPAGRVHAPQLHADGVRDCMGRMVEPWPK